MISALKRLVSSSHNAAQSAETTTNSGEQPSNTSNDVNNNNQHLSAASNGQSVDSSPNKTVASGGGGGGGLSNSLNNGMQLLQNSLQNKFKRGVHYNMKVVIRGDYNTGKSTMWRRLQGHPFAEAYEPSEEIRVANINWNARTRTGAEHIVKVIFTWFDYVKEEFGFGIEPNRRALALNLLNKIKVEVWDVVDRSKKKRSMANSAQVNGKNNLKLDNAVQQFSQIDSAPALDAEFIDVYKVSPNKKYYGLYSKYELGYIFLF